MYGIQHMRAYERANMYGPPLCRVCRSERVSKIDIPLANGLNAKLDVYMITLFELDGYLSCCACQIRHNKKTLSFL